MAKKYTILKVLIQDLIRVKSLNKGFTLLELLFGLIIMILVGGLAMNAFIQASTTFNKDKRSIDSSQNLSAVLEMIGNDIKQSGELIGETSFPVIEFNIETASTADTASIPNARKSSRIIIRRAIQPSLPLCTAIAANAATLPTTIRIADSTTGSHPSCIFTPSATAVPLASILPPSSALPDSWKTAINIREYRCQLDNLNPNYLTTSIDLCATTRPIPSLDRERLRAVIHDGSGHIRSFNYSDDNFLTTSTQYNITVGNDDLGVSTMSNDPRNKAFAYSLGSPIYLIEEKIYALDNNGNLTLSVNGGTPSVLIRKIAQFNVSARVYNDSNARNMIVNPTPAVVTTLNPAPSILAGDICANPPTTPTATDPQYVCKFNYNNLPADPANSSWKIIAGVKIDLQTKYDATGQGSAAYTATDTKNIEKASASAEYFPRNVLSK